LEIQSHPAALAEITVQAQDWGAAAERQGLLVLVLLVGMGLEAVVGAVEMVVVVPEPLVERMTVAQAVTIKAALVGALAALLGALVQMDQTAAEAVEALIPPTAAMAVPELSGRRTALVEGAAELEA
jgi:hypothetical protein